MRAHQLVDAASPILAVDCQHPSGGPILRGLVFGPLQVLLLEAIDPFADRGFDFSLRPHGELLDRHFGRKQL